MIAGATFGPEAVKDLQAAFAQAWDALSGTISADAYEAERVRLARTLLALRSEEPLSVTGLRDAALKVMRARCSPLVAETRQARSSDARGG